MKNAAKHEKSQLIENVAAILIISEKTNENLTKVLRSLSNQLRDIHILKLERIKKTKITSMTQFILGSFAMPFMLTYMNRMFELTTTPFLINFLLIIAIISSIISAVSKGNSFESAYFIPIGFIVSLIIITIITGTIPYFENITL
ncbi:MAG: hypothetical protein K0B02_00125 [DPANN group archaeon]|nr:hypothetical protein [DPANN group archaeon]